MRGAYSRRRFLGSAVAVMATAVTGAAMSGGAASARSTDSLIVNTAGARLRSGAGTGYSVVASLAKGTEVRYLANGGNANGYTWYKVKVLSTGREGFVASSLLSAPGTSGGDPGFPPNVVVTQGPVRLRQYPGTSQPVLATLSVGAKGWLTQRTSAWVDGYQWFEVTFLVNGQYITGFVAANFVRVS
ncbi:MAG TPA: SH3 domain-containing protein [Thermomicrobiales bacterium]|nr:SH3 domain-containing protein [Thermomicrobiales bacterium]